MTLDYIVTSRTLKESVLPPAKSFNTLMVIVEDATRAGEVKTYTGTEQARTDGVAKKYLDAIDVIFSQELAPSFIKVGFVDAFDKDNMDNLSKISDWYITVFHDEDLTDGDIPDLASWFASNKKIGIVTDTNAGALDGTAGLTKALFDAQYDHMFAIYAPLIDQEDGVTATDKYRYISYAVASGMASVNFDEADSYYALPHLIRNIVGVSTVGLTPTEYETLTGYTIGVGYDKTKGLLGNVYADYEGFKFGVYSGLMPTGVGVNEIHFIDWLNHRIQEDQARYFKQNKVTTYRDKDLAGLMLNFRISLLRGVRAGGLIEEQIAVESMERLKERITDFHRSNKMLPAIQANIICSGHIQHTAYESVCQPYTRRDNIEFQ